MYMAKVLLTTAVIIVMAAAGARAGVAVTPDRHIALLSPGETKIVEYQIFNSGPQDLYIDIEPENWTDIGIDIYSWLSLDEHKLTVRAGETKPLKVRVSSLEGFKGEAVGMLFLCYKEDKDSSLNIRNGIPLYLVMKGTERYNLKVDDIEIGYIEEGTPVSGLKILVTAANDGNIHVKPDVKVMLYDKDGDLLREFLLEESAIILRGRNNAYSFFWRRKVLPDGDYKIAVELSYEDKIEGIKGTADFSIVNRELLAH